MRRRNRKAKPMTPAQQWDTWAYIHEFNSMCTGSEHRIPNPRPTCPDPRWADGVWLSTSCITVPWSYRTYPEFLRTDCVSATSWCYWEACWDLNSLAGLPC